VRSRPHELHCINEHAYYILVMENLAFEIAETAHALRRSFDRRAAALGVTRAQWKVLFRLSRQPGLRQVELADKLDVEPITLSRIIDRLADAGLVERTPDPADRRAWRLQVTDTAQPLIAKLRKLAEGLVDDAFNRLSKDDLESMRDNLTRIRENLAAAEACRKAANQ
jgi:MarR family transcriptional regulator, transcriptional regulator for hemolysin